MRNLTARAALLLVCLASIPFATALGDEIEVGVQKLHPKAIKVGSGETYDDSMLAVASEKGLVVVDTGTTVTLTRAYRAKIEDVFGRDDFLYVVNTHYHYDHTVGNPVFPEATVIGHELTLDGLITWNRTRDRFVEQQQARVDGWQSTLDSMDADDENAPRLRDLVASYGQMCEDLRGEYEPRLPTITFSDRLHLDLGDMTMDLYYFGPGTHTGDDIMVHFPELGVVATGDLLHDRYVQFLFEVDPEADVLHKVAVFDAILSDPNLEHVVPVHSRVMTRAEFQARRDYANDVWNGITAVIEAGGSRETAREQLRLEARFAYLAELEIEADSLVRQHEATVTYTWMVAKGGEDARAAVLRIIEEEGIDAAVAAFEQMLQQREEDYFFDENAFNRLGYRFLGEGRIEEAVAVFEMNVKAYPESWNPWDSLGEGYAARGEIDRAIAAYAKSVELNPDNDNGAAQLERLEAEKTDGS
jgi:glyoxylase-like metal-dependent hydrolase (beta-lactamase superfamily II)